MHEHSFKYANFSFEDTVHTLPVSSTLEESRLGHGTYCSVVIPHGERHVLKLSRLIGIDMHGKVDYRSAEPYLVSPDNEETHAVDALLKLGQCKNEIHAELHRYLHGHIPERLGSCIVASPRRKIEQHRMGKHLTPDIEQFIPHTEISLMEVYERVNTDYEFLSMRPEAILDLFADRDFQSELYDFNQHLAHLLVDRGVMVDICDSSMWIIKPDGEIQNIFTQLDLNDLISGKIEGQVIPRNCVYEDGTIKLIDTFPVVRMNQTLKPYVPKVIGAVQTGDIQELDRILKTFHHPQRYSEILWLARYVTALGFSQSPNITASV